MSDKRLLTRPQAAAYLGISPTTFSVWVSGHKMPPPVPGTRRWDKLAIDAKLDEISGLAGSGNVEESDFDKWKRERDARKAKGRG